MSVDISKRDTSTGNKLILERTLAGNLIYVVGKRFYQLVDAFASNFRPFLLRDKARFLQEVKPKARGQSIGAEGTHLFLRVGRCQPADILLHHRPVGLMNPVDSYQETVIILVQITCGMRGEFEYGRSAHAPVGNQESSLCPKLGAWHHDRHRVYYCTHQCTERGV